MNKTQPKILGTILIILIASIALLLFDFFMWDALNAFDNPGASAAMGLLCYAFVFLYALLTMIVMGYVIVRIKQIKLFALIPCVIIALTVLFFTYIPYTGVYQRTYFALEKNHLNVTIQMLRTNTLVQTDSDEFIVPYRLTSHTGKIYAHNSNRDTKAIFTIYRGFHKSSILLYTSSTDDIRENAFNFGPYETNIADIKKLDTYWYTANIEY